MKKYFIILLCTTVLITFLYTYKPTVTHTTEDILIVGTHPNFPPFEYLQNGKIIGFEIDLIEKIAQKLNKKIVFKDTSFDTLLLEAQLGKIHMIVSGMTPTAKRAEQVLFTKPYLTDDPLIAITLASSPKPHSLEDFKGKEVLVNDGYTAESFMAQQPGVILKRLQTPAESFLALTTQKAYAYVSAASVTKSFFEQYGSQNFHSLALNAYDSYALAVSKKYPELLPTIDKALEALKDEGFLDILKKKWNLS
jgi:arginine/lysine/histidine transporter system substrate-binding protein